MTEKEYRKLGKSELITIIYELQSKNNLLNGELSKTKEKLADSEEKTRLFKIRYPKRTPSKPNLTGLFR